MSTEFINGWNRTQLPNGNYHWNCPYCHQEVTTHFDNVDHGCFLKEYGLGDLARTCLNKIGITKKRVNWLLRRFSKSKTVKCECNSRLGILNTIGRWLKINYLLTTLKHGTTPARFAARCRRPTPQKINPSRKALRCPVPACPVPNPAPGSLPPLQRNTGQARPLKNETP